MTRLRDELPPEEEALLGIRRPTREQEAEAEERRKEILEIERAMLENLLRMSEFRRWMMMRLVEFNTFVNPIAASPNGFPDPLATQFEMGKKAAGWVLWEALDAAAPDLASLMRREARDQPLVRG